MQQDASQKPKTSSQTAASDEDCQLRFAEILKENGGRLTEERQVLLKAVCNMKGHFEAEHILDTLKKRGHKISLATIYRNLSLIIQAGIIRRVSTAPNNPTKMEFECIWGKEHHDHLSCWSCGKRVEFSYPAIDVLQEEAAKEHGFVLTSHHLELIGLCPVCQKDRPSLEPKTYRLIDLAPGDTAQITKLNGDRNMITKLQGFGLHVGRKIRLIRFAPFGGPLLIEDVDNQSRLMTGRELAAHVLVAEVLEPNNE